MPQVSCLWLQLCPIPASSAPLAVSWPQTSSRTEMHMPTEAVNPEGFFKHHRFYQDQALQLHAVGVTAVAAIMNPVQLVTATTAALPYSILYAPVCHDARAPSEPRFLSLSARSAGSWKTQGRKSELARIAEHRPEARVARKRAERKIWTYCDCSRGLVETGLEEGIKELRDAQRSQLHVGSDPYLPSPSGPSTQRLESLLIGSAETPGR